MKTSNNGQVIGIPISYSSSSLLKKTRKDSLFTWMNKFSKTIKDHVAVGEVERAFRKSFSTGKREKLVKTMQCYLSTTSGPISGMLFISTDKIAFHSERSITVTSPTGNLIKVPYKVLIPLNRIKRVNPSENSEKPGQKYVQIVTVDDFEFWFMGFVSYQKSIKNLRVQDVVVGL
ncbi:GRAM domain-containing protein [Dioscorea alata]|uniref:GRAM domain-containing protein n=1 Tax=Dioscorea alata TaxID=55571 RepID=A0ACB7WU16_DIOAL|nr:GRAM domain-containing protein [Dioscorea alata]